MKISIVIPTRNRAEYLKGCIESCLASPDPNIEVIVSDNNSLDNTREVVSLFNDTRLKYFATGQSVSMRQNFEFALQYATGEYIIYIGDDDGVLSYGLQSLRNVLERYKPDIVGWRHLTYHWPSQDPPKAPVLKFKVRDFFGRMQVRRAEDVLDKFLKGDEFNYRHAGNIYHGCVSRRVVNASLKRNGQYFNAQIPDVYVALVNLLEAKNYYWFRNPVTLAGQSPKSNGASVGQYRTTLQRQVVNDFSNLIEQDVVPMEADMRINSVSAMTYANLVKLKGLYSERAWNINHEAWREHIRAEVSRTSPGLPQRSEVFLETFFAKLDPQYQPKNMDEVSTGVTHVQSDAGQLRDYVCPSYPKYLSDVGQVSRWVDSVVGSAYTPSASIWRSAVTAFMKRPTALLRACLSKKVA